MDSWESVIKTLCGDAPGSLGDVAEALDLTPGTVSGWKKRGIPAPHWASVVALAAERGKRGISLKVLATLAERKLEEARP